MTAIKARNVELSTRELTTQAVFRRFRKTEQALMLPVRMKIPRPLTSLCGVVRARAS
jgi:predicted Zn-dependent protease